MSRSGLARHRAGPLLVATLLVAASLALWLAHRPEHASHTDSASPTPVEDLRLEIDEAAGGHTLSRHVAKSDEDLRSRLRREPSISASSTFADRAAAEAVVAGALAQRAAQVSDWLSGGRRGDLAIDYRGEPGRPIGRVLRRGEPSPRPASDARVVLRGRDDGYYVLTAYPLEDNR